VTVEYSVLYAAEDQLRQVSAALAASLRSSDPKMSPKTSQSHSWDADKMLGEANTRARVWKRSSEAEHTSLQSLSN
jgi:hypothetical protein